MTRKKVDNENGLEETDLGMKDRRKPVAKTIEIHNRRISMGREVRRVPKDWQHPTRDDGEYIPLLEGYERDKKEFLDRVKSKGYDDAMAYFGSAPNERDYMPDWSDSERTHYMMYEDVTEGTPISPAFETLEELARWLADNGASAFGNMTANYDQWLAMCYAGWSVSAVYDESGFRSGVEASDQPETGESRETI